MQLTLSASHKRKRSGKIHKHRIAFGQDAHSHEFDYQVSVRQLGEHHCGGAIITESRIISAAHCVTDIWGTKLDAQNYQILAGTNYVNNYADIDDEYKSFLKPVALIIVHHKYDVEHNDYDVTVLIPDTPFDLMWKHLGSIAISTAWQDSPETECVVTGWGQNEFGVYPNKLQFVDVNIVPIKICEKQYSFKLSKQMICALGTYGGDSQPGDSGGPLVCNDTLEGLVSFGKSTAAVGTVPAVYTRVSEIGQWAMTTNGASSKNCTLILILLLFSFL